MTITREQNEELDSLKGSIESIDKKIESAKVHYTLAVELENKEDQKKYDKVIDFGLERIRQMVSIQAQSMKVEYNLMIDLIFDRERTLEIIK